MIRRICNIPELNSFFLFGPRQTGKTTLVKLFLNGKQAWQIDLLDRQVYLRYIRDPSQFYLEAKAHLKDNPKLDFIFIDEIQKCPAILDEVQRLIQEDKVKFVLTGSSARSLKRSSANLLGGRALEKHIFPLTYVEIGESSFKLDDCLMYGSLPSVFGETANEVKIDMLMSYVSTYLAEEIQQESLVRNLPGFLSFLEVAAQNSGGILNYSNIARDAQIQSRTVQSYYQILIETLIGIELKAYSKSVRRRLRVTPKFYLFDIGVLNSLERQLRSDPDVVRYGKLFEHFIVLETYRLCKYLSVDARLFFWRTKDDQEVDLLIENKGKIIAAVEIKSSTKVSPEYLSALSAYHEEHPEVPRYVVARVPEAFELNGIQILPWQKYMKLLQSWLST